MKFFNGFVTGALVVVAVIKAKECNLVGILKDVFNKKEKEQSEECPDYVTVAN